MIEAQETKQAGSAVATDLVMRICPMCKREFTPKRKNQTYCRDRCRIGHWMENNPRISIEKIKAEARRKRSAE